jgi:hypothetical protein
VLGLRRAGEEWAVSDMREMNPLREDHRLALLFWIYGFLSIVTICVGESWAACAPAFIGCVVAFIVRWSIAKRNGL